MRRVLGAADRDDRGVAGDADVAADALADVVVAALLDLHAAGTGSAIDGRAAPTKSSTPSRTIRAIRSGDVKRPTPTTGFVVSCLRPRRYDLLSALLAEAGGDRVVLPLARDEVPEVGQLADEPENVLDLRAAEAAGAAEVVDHDPAGDGGPAVDLGERVLEHLAQEPGARRRRRRRSRRCGRLRRGERNWPIVFR